MASRSDWDERLKRWAKSRTSIEKFAAREGIDAKQLKWWRWKLGVSAAPPRSTAKPAAPRFVPVRVVESPASRAEGGAALEIVLGNGRVVRVPAGFDGVELERVLAIASREQAC